MLRRNFLAQLGGYVRRALTVLMVAAMLGAFAVPVEAGASPATGPAPAFTGRQLFDGIAFFQGPVGDRIGIAATGRVPNEWAQSMALLRDEALAYNPALFSQLPPLLQSGDPAKVASGIALMRDSLLHGAASILGVSVDDLSAQVQDPGLNVGTCMTLYVISFIYGFVVVDLALGYQAYVVSSSTIIDTSKHVPSPYSLITVNPYITASTYAPTIQYVNQTYTASQSSGHVSLEGDFDVMRYTNALATA